MSSVPDAESIAGSGGFRGWVRGVARGAGRLWRTTAFKLATIQLIVFAVFSAMLVGMVAWQTGRLVAEQTRETLDQEIRILEQQYSAGGIRRLVAVVERRSQRPGSNLYLVTTFQGEVLAGNVGALPPGLLSEDRWTETAYRRLDETDAARAESGRSDAVRPDHRAMVRIFQLPGGFRLLIGRDVEERDKIRAVVGRALRISLLFIVLVGVGAAFFVARRVLTRIDAVTQSTARIMAGNMAERLPVTGRGDEFDRLGENVNAMLARIEALMQGLKDVSDNIAHDLKTPLTRLRNRAEALLRSMPGENGKAAEVEGIIDEADGLIRTFNALLLIARTESGAGRDSFIQIDLAALTREVGELYEAVAEEKGLKLAVEAENPLLISGQRELLAQVIANLLDNAVKYASHDPQDESDAPDIVLRCKGEGADAMIEVVDRGPGVPAADRQRVLERFVRLEASRSQPGAGLGLSLVAAVARLHSGEVSLDDNAPGLIIRLRLPAREVA